MPLVIVLLVIAGVAGRAEYHEYLPAVHNTWAWAHRVTAYGGAVAFAIAGASGAMYVLGQPKAPAQAGGRPAVRQPRAARAPDR
jgi:hypothetical protein